MAEATPPSLPNEKSFSRLSVLSDGECTLCSM
jgi:hypothetical protein